MRIITSLMSCLMALAGCDEKPSVTTITRVSDGGTDVVFSKTTLEDGVAMFQCFKSDSGRCHYLIYAERCPPAATGGQAACDRTTLDQFALSEGQRREIRGLPGNFRHCVARQASTSSPPGCGT